MAAPTSVLGRNDQASGASLTGSMRACGLRAELRSALLQARHQLRRGQRDTEPRVELVQPPYCFLPQRLELLVVRALLKRVEGVAHADALFGEGLKVFGELDGLGGVRPKSATVFQSCWKPAV